MPRDQLSWVLWRSKPSEETGLSEERRALAERYTIDAAEAERRGLVAGQGPATPVSEPSRAPGQESRPGADASSAVSEGHAAEEPPVPRKKASLTEHLLPRIKGRHTHHVRPVAASEPYAEELHLGESASGLAEESDRLRCVRCGRQGSADDEGWTLQLREDDELQTFCKECAAGTSGRTHVDAKGLTVSAQEAADLLGVTRDFFDEYLSPELHVVHGGRRIPISVRDSD